MPNYSQGTKLALASAEEPPYLTVGTDVSAKYKGAFCEAKIIDVNKHVKLRVLFDGISGSYLIDDTDVKPGSALETGSKIEAKHPSKKKQQIYAQATISKILDHSRYTVIFDDGDQCVLRRNSICLKSGKHFAESETLDQLPLTNPEHFGNPVKVGAYEQQQLQLQQRDQQQSASKSTNQSQSDSNTNSTSAPTSSSSSSRSHTIKQESTSTTSDKNKGEATPASTPGGRRGGKGRKRRESVTKHAADLDDGSLDSSQDSADADPVNSNVKFDLIAIGVKLMIQYGKGKIQNVYEAKVNKIETNPNGKIRYFVHYTGWNNRYDEWVTKNRIVSIVTEKENGRDGRSRQPEPIPIESFTSAKSSSSNNNITREKNKEKDKDKEKELEREREREKARERELEKERERELERRKEEELAKAREKEREEELRKEKEREKELEEKRRKEKELEREREKLREKERKKELEREQERLRKEEKEKEEERKRELEKQKELEKEKEKDKLKEKEKERERAKEKDAPTKTRRSRRSDIASAASTTPATPSASSTRSLESQQANQTTQPLNVAPSQEASTQSTSKTTDMEVDSDPEKPVEQDKVDKDDKKRSDVGNAPSKPFKSLTRPMDFCSEIDEPDCDKKISILQERIIELRRFYLSLKSGLADLERRRKRPRTEVS